MAKQAITEPGDFATRHPNECWVKIPERPTVDAIRVCFESLVSQLSKHDVQRPVKGIKISPQDKTIRITLKEVQEQ